MGALALSNPTTTKYDTILELGLQPDYQGKWKSWIVKGVVKKQKQTEFPNHAFPAALAIHWMSGCRQ